MSLFTKTNQPQLDIEEASRILENIFLASQVEPNSVPLDVLTAYSNYRRERFSLQRTLLVIIMVLFLLLPFLFIAPGFSIESKSPEGALNPSYEVALDTHMPVQRVTAVIDGHNVPVYETDTHIYSIEPTVNGDMTVSVTLINRQTITHSIEVNNVDTEAPLVVSNSADHEHIYLYLSDNGSGIDYEKIRAVGLSGRTYTPVSYDTDQECVAFEYPEESLNVYIPDKAENMLQLILTVQNTSQK